VAGTPPQSFLNGGQPPFRRPASVISPRRKTRVTRAVEDGLRQWNGGHPVRAPRQPSPEGGLLPGDVRRRLQNPILTVHPPMMRQMRFTASMWLTFVRLMQLFSMVVLWYSQRAWDVIRRRDSVERRARRARALVEWMGGSIIKLGQQAAMRIDLLPYAYSLELSKMLDSSPPFPAEYAIQRIEGFLGKPLHDVFDRFDPKPIGSASVACVYQAYLKSGERVAIKVRRPHIGEEFVADLKGLTIVMKFLELLTVIRPGTSANFLSDYSGMLLDELDFFKEARSNELFRRQVRKDLKHVSAPRVYFEYSCGDILVTEFVSGVWLRELLVAVEQKDYEALELLRQQDIDPKVIARRLLRANQFGIYENLLFHADPHPSNVVVQPGNILTFIDFGACGAYTAKERNNWKQLAYYHDKGDVGRMVQAAMAMMEPLPPVNIDEVAKRLEVIFWDDLYAYKSKHVEWWERTSAKIWIRFLALAREYGLPMTLNTLRMVRSSLLYETIAARLYPTIDAFKEYRIYAKSAGKRAKKRVQGRARKLLFGGLKDASYLNIEQILEMGNRLMYLSQRQLDIQPYRFSMLLSKATYAITAAVQAFGWVTMATVAGTVFVTVRGLLYTPGYRLSEVNLWRTGASLFSMFPFQMILLVILIAVMRRIMFRFFDPDLRDNASGLT